MPKESEDMPTDSGDAIFPFTKVLAVVLQAVKRTTMESPINSDFKIRFICPFLLKWFKNVFFVETCKKLKLAYCLNILNCKQDLIIDIKTYKDR